MAVTSFQFRVCQNPDCGLRYPLLEGSLFGERCPMCLGGTVVVAESAAVSEAARPSELPPPAGGPEALLDNIRSAWNVGSIFRSAEGFGLRHLYLCGITPTPDNEQVKKTALGAENSLLWSSHRNAVTLVEDLKARRRPLWVLERTEQSLSIASVLANTRVPDDLVLVVGNEQAGVDPGVLSLADKIVHIDMQGWKRSLNVAIAFSVAAHALSRG